MVSESGPQPGRTVRVLPGTMAIIRLEPDAAPPAWASQAEFLCLMRTRESLTIVCSQTGVPVSVPSDRDWRCLEVQGPLDLSMTGVLASLATALAQAGVPIFALSSYETDFILVKGAQLSSARQALEDAGYRVVDGQSPPAETVR
jgi:hypothetical protein